MFISVLFAVVILCNGVLGKKVYICDQVNEYANYMQCLNQWRVVKEGSRGHSAFLRDLRLIDEICIFPEVPGVEEMDKCVTKAISPYCNSINVHWKGLKQFVKYLCEYREEFEGQYARCRKSKGFQSAYEICMSTHVRQINSGENNCRSYKEMDTCLNRALADHCSQKAAAFFSDAFAQRDDPLRAISCKKDKEDIPDYVFDISEETKDASNENEKQSKDKSPVMSARVEFNVDIFEVDVNELNRGDTLIASLYITLSVHLLRVVVS